MGTAVLPEVIDYEIRDVIATLNNFSFIQTKASCSGWTGENNVSDGTNRSWIGNPYVVMESLDNSVFLGDFVPFIMSKLIFDSQATDAATSVGAFEEKLNGYGLEYTGKQFFSFTLEYRNNKVDVMIFLNDTNESSDTVEKMWNLFSGVLQEYIER